MVTAYRSLRAANLLKLTVFRMPLPGYRLAVVRAVEKANKAIVKEASEAGVEPQTIPHWHPNQLRHSKATEVRKLFGLEAAQVTLGHAHAKITEVYAERDTKLAAEIARKIG